MVGGCGGMILGEAYLVISYGLRTWPLSSLDLPMKHGKAQLYIIIHLWQFNIAIENRQEVVFSNEKW